MNTKTKTDAESLWNGSSDEEFGTEDEMRLPPRRVIHAADTTKWSRRFHVSLVLLLVMLIVGMVVWSHFHQTQ